MNTAEKWHGTTIVLLRKGGETIVAGDGQVSLGNTVLKSKAKKVRKIENRGVIAGFAGSTADVGPETTRSVPNPHHSAAFFNRFKIASPWTQCSVLASERPFDKRGPRFSLQ